jgi:hypothetical protein
MTHADVRRQLSEYLEGDLSERDEERVRAHLEECAECGAELRVLRRLVRELRELGSVEPPRDLADAVVARLRAGEGRRPRLRLGFLERLSASWMVPLVAAAGLGAIALLEGVDGQGTSVAPWGDPFQAIRETGVPVARMGRRASVQTASLGPEAARSGALPPIASCLEGAPRGAATAEACAAWYSWFVAMALEDSRGFVHEVEHLPAPAREPWLRRLADFAQRSGSAPLVGRELRKSRDPQAAVIASRFEYGPGVRQVDWNGH